LPFRPDDAFEDEQGFRPAGRAWPTFHLRPARARLAVREWIARLQNRIVRRKPDWLRRALRGGRRLMGRPRDRRRRPDSWRNIRTPLGAGKRQA
jgi:hypothetical protein